MPTIENFVQLRDLVRQGFLELEADKRRSQSETVKRKIELLKCTSKSADPTVNFGPSRSELSEEAIRAIWVFGSLTSKGYDLGSFNRVYRRDLVSRAIVVDNMLWNNNISVRDFNSALTSLRD